MIEAGRSKTSTCWSWLTGLGCRMRTPATYVVISLCAVIAATSVGAMAEPRRVSLVRAAELGVVDVTAKGGHVGDKLKIVIDNTQAEDFEVEILPGDLAVNKNKARQNLILGMITAPAGVLRTEPHIVNGKNLQKYILTVRSGDKAIAEGGWTFCVDAHKGSPQAGDKFDIAPNLDSWKCDHPSAARLLNLVQLANESDMYNSEMQLAVWFYTDPDSYGTPVSDTVRGLIRDSGGDPFNPEHGFPHLSNPNSGSTGTGAVVPPEANSMTLGWDAPDRELDLIFTGGSMTWESLIEIPRGATLSIAVKDAAMAGDIWEASLYEEVGEYWELQGRSQGDGSNQVFSDGASAQIDDGTALVRVRYVDGVDVWPALMFIRLEIRQH